MDISAFYAFLISAALGALVGIEREMAHVSSKKGHEENTGPFEGFGGIRSYALIGLFGAMSAWLDTKYGGHSLTIAGFGVMALWVGISHAYASFRKDNIGITSEYAAMVIYLVGVVVTMGQTTLAVTTTIGVMALLSAKDGFQTLRSKISREEFQNAMKFAVVAFVVLPILPDAKFAFSDVASMFGADFSIPVRLWTMKFFNPHSVWFFVVVMASVEFAGYILSKTMGTKGGILASGAVGGLVSSTAVTAAMTARSKEDAKNSASYAVATLTASSIMLVRVVVIVALVAGGLLGAILLPAAFMFTGLAGSVGYLLLKARAGKKKEIHVEEKLESPFRIIPAIKFAAFVVLIKFASAVGVSYKDSFDPQTLYYAIGALSGLADVDAISLDMAGKFSDGSIPATVASAVVLIAVISNNFVKAGIAYRFGEKAFGRSVLAAFALSAVLGAIGLAMEMVS
jgi:uncharacterized membrane protein (DUF4010 family)